VIHHGDLFDVLPTLDADSIDACVTDPPYGLGFMAKEWDVPGGIGAFPMRRRVETDAVNTGASRQGGRQRSGNDFAKRQKRDA
jgi:DNA modification methylase